MHAGSITKRIMVTLPLNSIRVRTFYDGAPFAVPFFNIQVIKSLSHLIHVADWSNAFKSLSRSCPSAPSPWRMTEVLFLFLFLRNRLFPLDILRAIFNHVSLELQSPSALDPAECLGRSGLCPRHTWTARATDRQFQLMVWQIFYQKIHKSRWKSKLSVISDVLHMPPAMPMTNGPSGVVTGKGTPQICNDTHS